MAARRSLLAKVDGQAVGYKVGYKLNPELFYSWIGGVTPPFRGQGVARLLMAEQHQLLKEAGFKRVRTKTRNEFRSMLLLNIKMGFDITDTYTAPGETLRIVLEKDL